ncbi:exodeoxyribonuclease VII large subunit [Ammoniphilus sp. CFH 90114]|uniref:exodeoxyribonuclease VII large subunit n=1 Tax=Ammoniphilus sp. CFH 90114 TaxID=2493665 RepID=UPI00100E9EBF|nr:exodeoxyribonuclease VII large subunit [Ammoniphilus sp. CFH 90114]RXT13789.1 exodeoxyribonuclease VII large subunit [Ammoniphilus sp. CFH 90114]
MENRNIYSVAEINRYLKDLIEGNTQLQDVWIRGEISNFTHHSRGHMYFTVKDEDAVLKAVMFAGNNRYLKFIPKNGTKVLVRGAISVYESGGQYQLIAREMQPDGIGSLYLAFEQLKQKLQEEGLFAPDRKKGLPVYPRAIGVVTSPTGAAVRDIITTIRRRYPIARIILVPVLVQGEQAPSSISKAIELMNKSEDAIDVLIVGRGGGSIEELWAFNTEIVARSIFASRIPIISAVGHETDFTIADFVADIRAATPTAAAELAVPHVLELRQRLTWLQDKLQSKLLTRLNQSEERFKRAHRSLVLKHPQKQVESANQKLDRLVDRFYLGMHRFNRERRLKLNVSTGRLQFYNPGKQLKDYRERLGRIQQGLVKLASQTVSDKRNDWLLTMARLDGLSPLKIMGRGYSLVYKNEELVKSIHQLDPGDGVKVKLMDGTIDCSVWALEERKNHGKE